MESARPHIEAPLTRLKLPLVALVVLSLFSGRAHAVDWELLYRLNETVKASDNIQLLDDPDGITGSSQSLFGLDFKTHTRTVDWGLSGDVGYLAYFGADVPDPSTTLTLSAKSDLLKRTKNTDYTASAFFTRTPASTSEQDDLGIPNQLEIDRFNYGANTSVTHRVNKRNNLKFGTNDSRTDFSELGSGLSPSIFVEGSLNWTHRLTSLVNANLVTSVGWQNVDSRTDDILDIAATAIAMRSVFVQRSIPETETMIYKTTFGADAKLTKRLSVVANAGVSIIDQLQGQSTGASVGFIGDLSLFYQPVRDLTFELSVAQTVAPGNLGDLRETRKYNGSTVYTINDDSTFVLDVAFTESSGASGQDSSRKTFSITPQYIYQIVRHWKAVLGYQWIMSDTASGTSDSNTVFVTLSHSGTLRP